MSCLAVLNRFLFVHRRQVAGSTVKSAHPDDCPLYSYRCTDGTYRELRQEIESELREALAGQPPAGFEACFCLYAAETFRREHEGGSWTWRTVFDPVGAEVPSNQTIVGWVEKGLKYWKRKILTGAAGQRLALATIACEGGLPLRLIQKEGANLRKYFRRMLQAYHERVGDIQDLELLARRQIDALPQTLRNEGVVRLSAALIGRTVELQEIIRDAADPIEALDAQEPDWRRTLPLRLDDETAAALFKNLVEESRAISFAIAARPSWQGVLEESGPRRFVVKKTLQFPSLMPLGDLEGLIGRDPKPRVRLLLHARHRSEPVAVLSQISGQNVNEPAYRREWLRRNGVALTGVQVTETHRVLLHDGEQETPVALENGDTWGESPWIFVPTKDDGRWVWFCEGSTSTRATQAAVAVSDSARPEPFEGGACVPLGEIPEIGRRVFQISGTVDFMTPDGDRYRVRCGTGSDMREVPQLKGRELPHVLNMRPVYLGVPSFHDRTMGNVSQLAEGELQWRPVGDHGDWVKEESRCTGRVWLRLVDPVTGVERIRRMADVVPGDTQIHRSIGDQQQSGRYDIRTSGLMRISVEKACSAVTVVHDEIKEECAVQCSPVHNSTIEPLSVQLEWATERSVSLELPYPQKGAVFQLDGRTLPVDELVALDRLYGLWLMIQNPSGGERFLLDTELVGGATGIRGLGTAERLPPLRNGELKVNVGLWVDGIRHLLAATDDPSAVVRLSVRSQGGRDLARLRVACYDMEIQPLRDSHSVRLPNEQVDKLGEGWSSRVSLAMLPLWSPEDTPVSLAMRGDDPHQWLTPTELEPGPWWIIGRDGDWLRFRPLLWTVGESNSVIEEEPSGGKGLANAIRDPDPDRRGEKIDALIEEMGAIPAHPDWDLLQAYVALAMDLPPSSLDVFRHLIHHPRTLAMAALRADDERFRRLMAFADQMPFAWGLLPVDAWREAAHGYFSHLRQSLAEIQAGEEICFSAFEQFRGRATAARPYFESLCDWLQEQIFEDKSVSSSTLQLFRAAQPDFIAHLVEQEVALLLGRHDADENWPAWHSVTDLADSGLLSSELRFSSVTGFQRPVRCAPFVAAAIALGGYDRNRPPPELVYQIRVLRGFDTDWFDHAYAIGLTLGLARGNWEGCL